MFVINNSAIIAVAVKIRATRGRMIVVRGDREIRVVRGVRNMGRTSPTSGPAQPGSRQVGRLTVSTLRKSLPQKPPRLPLIRTGLQPGAVSLSFTPGFSPVIKDRENHRNRFNGFSVSFARQVLRIQSRECL